MSLDGEERQKAIKDLVAQKSKPAIPRVQTAGTKLKAEDASVNANANAKSIQDETRRPM